MDADDQRTRVRVAVHADDPEAIVALLRPGPDHDSLQLAGDAVLAALTADVEGAAGLGREFVDALRERRWTGDAELADQLDARLGAPAPMLRPLPVDLEQLAGILEGDPMLGGGRIDLRDGEVWPQPAIEYAREIGEEDEDESEERYWLPVHCEGSRDGYRDMEAFIATITDPDHADRLEIAIQGRGAFRRFKDVLARDPGELERWFAFCDERERGRARAWLADAGYAVGPSSA